MADFETIRSVSGARASQIDEGLRAHMNKVYGTMSVGMIITALAAWAISGLATTSDPALAVVRCKMERCSQVWARQFILHLYVG